MTALSPSYDCTLAKQIERQVKILTRPFRIVYFRLNGSNNPNRVLKDGEPVNLSWHVEGENVNVILEPYGNVLPKGSTKLIANQAFPHQIELVVTDKFSQQPLRQGISIKVEIPTAPNNNVAPNTSIPRNNTSTTLTPYEDLGF